VQGPLPELRADDKVENAGAELVTNAPYLREHGVRAADDDLAELDAVGELAPRRALPLRHSIGAVIARLPHACSDGLVLIDEADPRRQCAHIGKSRFIRVGDMEHGAVDDVLRRGLPTRIAGAGAVVLHRALGEWHGRESEADADMVARRELPGLGAGAGHVKGRVRLLHRARPDRDRAVLVIAAEPPERPR